MIEHPDGKFEKIYFSVTAGEVMVSNPGHYIALVTNSIQYGSTTGRRLELLRPDEVLHVSHIYRLISFEEILKLNEFGSKKLVRVRRPPIRQDMSNGSLAGKSPVVKSRILSLCGCIRPEPSSEFDEFNSASGLIEKQQENEMHETHNLRRHGTLESHYGVLKIKRWRPSLQSIVEVER